MRKIIFILLFIIVHTCYSQEDTNTLKTGTIKVAKKGTISKVIYDNVDYRLIALDQYGNVMDSAVVLFTMKTTINGIAKEETAQGPFLTNQMINYLGRVDSGTYLFFTNIKVKDKSGQIISWPDIKVSTGFKLERDE